MTVVTISLRLVGAQCQASFIRYTRYNISKLTIQWKFDLADIDLAENLDFKDTLQKI